MDDATVNEGEMREGTGVRTFRSSLFWMANLFCAPIIGFFGFTGIMLWDAMSEDMPKSILYSFSAAALLGVILYLPGNLSVLWPYAVRVESSAVTLFGPFKAIVVPAREIGEIENSPLWQGYVVHLLKPRAALTLFVIPWYFGSERRALIAAVRQASEATGGGD